MAAPNLTVLLLHPVLILITMLYVGLIIFILVGYRKLPVLEWKIRPAVNQFSIVIPYRNEAENMECLFRSIRSLNYPGEKFEIFLVNDASTDGSLEMAENFQAENPQLKITLLKNSRVSVSPKKDAILTAIKASRFNYIATTDADCTLPENWLTGFDLTIRKTNAKLIAGPVAFNNTDYRLKAFQRFEELDFLSLQATTMGSFGLEQAFMCNAANLCYHKQDYLKYCKEKTGKDIVSGDDVFLLQSFVKEGRKVVYLNNEICTVRTMHQQTISALLDQRKRWAAKTTGYHSLLGKFAGLVVFLMNFSLIIFAVLAMLNYIPYTPLLLAFLFKFNIDFALIYHAAKFFKRETVMRDYFWSSLLYPFFVTYVTLSSMFRGYDWKGRRFKK